MNPRDKAECYRALHEKLFSITHPVSVIMPDIDQMRVVPKGDLGKKHLRQATIRFEPVWRAVCYDEESGRETVAHCLFEDEDSVTRFVEAIDAEFFRARLAQAGDTET